jgi:WD40 repeat protein
VTGGWNGAVKVWDARTGHELKTLDRQEKPVTRLAFNPKHTRLVSGGQEGLVKIWDWPQGKELTTLKGHVFSPVQTVAFSSDGTLLAAGSLARAIIWDAATFQELNKIDTPAGGVGAFTPDGRTLVTAPHHLQVETKRAFALWNVKSGKPLGTSNVAGLPGFLVGAFSVDGSAVYLMTADPPEARLGVFDIATGEERFTSHSGSVLCVAFSPDGRWLASGGKDGRVCLWDLTRRPSPDSGVSVRPLSGHTAEVWSVAFSADGRLLATGSSDGTIRLWNVADGRAAQVLNGHFLEPALLALSPDGETVAARSQDGSANLWNVTTGQQWAPIRGHVGPVFAVAFSPDGRWLASGGADKTVLLVERSSGQRQTFLCESTLTGLAFSPDSKTLAAISKIPGPSLRLWDLTTKKERPLAGHTNHVMGLAFHPAGNRVLTASLDGTVRLWETAPGRDESTLFDFRGADACHAVAFSPSGRHFAIGLGNGTIALLTTP